MNWGIRMSFRLLGKAHKKKSDVTRIKVRIYPGVISLVDLFTFIVFSV